MMEGYEFLQQVTSSVSGMFPRLSKLTALFLPALGVIQAAPTAQTCSDLINNLKLDSSVKLILTSPYPDNTTFQDPYSQAYNSPVPYLPAFCRVYANISTSPTSATLFEVWMPLETWNGRFLTVGNGGGAGGVAYPALGQGLRAGYATCSTDCGHNSSAFDGYWQALGEQVAIDFGWRAVHLSTVYSKSIAAQFYGQNYSKAYFAGCSSGGKQSVRSAEQFPDDFDGVLVGAPAYNWNYLNAYTIHVNSYQSDPSAPGYIPPTQLQFLAAKVIEACDALDGVIDDVISNPRNCHFRPESLLCKYFESNSTGCFTPAQVLTLHGIYQDYIETNSTYIFPAFEKGSESFWPVTVSGTTWSLQPLYYAFQVLNVSASSFDPYTLNYSTIAFAEQLDPGQVIASNPDLNPFFKKNGKVLHYHGWADGLIPSRTSIDYYESVERTVSSNFSQNYRLFMVPGMMHCASGPGPWVFNSNPQTWFLDPTADLLHQLVQWVENGTAPDTLLGTKYFNDTGPGIIFQRPICPYPEQAVWNGKERWQDPQNWHCK